jgi:AcrR family transcriptional regulator
MNSQSRAEAKTQAIIKAACICLGERGYAATTIADIAAEAGVSRGLLHYYFKNKEDLLAHALRASGEASLKLVEEIFASSKSAEDLAAGLTRILRATIADDPAYINLGLECWAVARESPTITGELRLLYGAARESFRRGLADAVQRGVIDPDITLEGLSALLVGVTDGLAVQLMLHPQLALEERTWEATTKAALALLRKSS